MASCAVAAYVISKVVSFHDRVNKLLVLNDDSGLRGKASVSGLTKNRCKIKTIDVYGNENLSPITNENTAITE